LSLKASAIPILIAKLPRKSPLLFLKIPPQAKRPGLPKEVSLVLHLT
jgi:hypothetical protein